MSMWKPITVEGSIAADASRGVLNDAASRAQNYLRTIRERHAGVTPKSLPRLSLLGGMMPDEAQEPTQILQLLDEIGSPAARRQYGRSVFRRRD